MGQDSRLLGHTGSLLSHHNCNFMNYLDVSMIKHVRNTFTSISKFDLKLESDTNKNVQRMLFLKPSYKKNGSAHILRVISLQNSVKKLDPLMFEHTLEQVAEHIG